MTFTSSPLAVALFLVIVATVLGISVYFNKKTSRQTWKRRLCIQLVMKDRDFMRLMTIPHLSESRVWINFPC